jgi:hypothetical protein
MSKPWIILEDVAQLWIGPQELGAHIMMQELLIRNGLDLIAGGDEEKQESLSVKRSYPEENLLQPRLIWMAEAVNGYKHRGWCELARCLTAATAAAV